MQRFLGSLNYVLDYYPNISRLSKLLHDRLKTNTISWSNLHTNLVKQIKKQVQTIHLLHLANPLAPKIVETDASDMTRYKQIKAEYSIRGVVIPENDLKDRVTGFQPIY